MRFEIFKRGIFKKQWYWRLVANNGRSIAVGGEGYYNRGDLLAAINLVKGTSNAPVHEVPN